MRGQIVFDELDSYQYSIYKPPEKPEFLIFFLHGSFSDEKFWNEYYEIMDDLIFRKEIKSVAGVAVSVGNSYWVDSEKYGNVESFFIESFVPYIKKIFPEIGRDKTILCGCSMGGYGALRYSLLYPELFSKAILLSPAMQYGLPHFESGAVTRGSFGEIFDENLWHEKNYPNLLESFFNKNYKSEFFIACGDKDYNYSENPPFDENDSFYNMDYQCALLYLNLCRKNPRPNVNAELRILSGVHDNKLWFRAFDEAIKFFLNSCMENRR